ncbi:hypothetical protein BRC99_04095 [Halobacteriales archaeon QS_7_69_60]|nr:MAG: hypothetical protein BRC99_04095 [Halobacteriales archaeon QS_7_69_60]
MTDADDDSLREMLLDHSDHRAVRNVFGAHTGRETAWNGRGGRFEHLTIWPPWSIGGFDHKNSARLAEFLAEKEAVRPTLHSATPFEDQEVLSSLSHRIWP